jgi:uncharacterized membrane protein
MTLAGLLSMSTFCIILFVLLPRGPVTAVRESSFAFAVSFGMIMLKETTHRRKAVALFLAVAGVSAVAS